MIEYQESLDSISADQLDGYFVGWPNPPSPEMHLRILEKADYVVVALDRETNRVVGFINAITDHILTAHIPLLEVLPEYQGRGIGSELVRRLLTRLAGLYMIDLQCDPSVMPFYDRLGMQRCTGMTKRDFAAQSGRRTP